MKELKNGLLTGLTLQLAIGPVFFYITNLALQRSLLDGLAGVLGVTLGDYFYITLSILGLSKLLENEKVKRIFGSISSIVLIIFGMMIIKGAVGDISSVVTTTPSNILSSFSSVFFLTLSSPLTIVLFTSLFTAKAVENNYTQKKLWLFGLGTGSATFLFMFSSVILLTLIKGAIPMTLIKSLNLLVGVLLMGYGGLRLFKSSGVLCPEDTNMA